MLKINGRDVNEYFMEKNIAAKINALSDVLYKNQCEIAGEKNDVKGYLHFVEALYLFATVNASKSHVPFSKEALIKNLIKMQSDIRFGDKVEAECSTDGEISLEDASVYLIANSSDLATKMDALSRCYINTLDSAGNAKDHVFCLDYYLMVTMAYASECFDGFTDKVPYSNVMIATLFDFCKKYSIFSALSKEDVECIYAGDNIKIKR